MSLVTDLRAAVRGIRRRAASSAVIAGILALGLGATTTLFSVVDALLVSSPPGVSESQRVVRVNRFSRAAATEWWTYPDFAFVGERQRVFTAIAAYFPPTEALTASAGEAQIGVRAGFVSPGYWEVLGARPELGRGFVGSESGPAAGEMEVVLSHGFWRSFHGADDEVLGSVLTLNGHPFTVVGVAAAQFRAASAVEDAPDLWLPLASRAILHPDLGAGWFELRPDHRVTWLQVLGRLRPGVEVEEAQAQMEVLAARLAGERPEHVREGQGIELLKPFHVRPERREQLERLGALLAGLALLVLAIAGVNAATLLLARASSYEASFGVRAALGAGRWQLVRRFLLEVLILTATAGLAGFLFALQGAALAARLLPFELSLPPAPGAGALALTLLLVLVVSVAAGGWPAWRAARGGARSLIARGRPEGRRSRVRDGLVVAQVALSIVLVTGAALFVRSLRAAEAVELGFETPDRLLVALELGAHGLEKEELRAFLAQSQERLRALPGVETTSLLLFAPFGGSWGGRVLPAESAGDPEEAGLLVELQGIGADYFAAMGIPLLRGRDFDAAELSAEARPTAVVLSESAVEALWPGRSGLGERLRLGDGEPATVVGVAADTRMRSLAPAAHEGPAGPLQVYLPIFATGRGDVHLLAHAPGAPRGWALQVPAILHETDPRVAVERIYTLDDAVERVLGPYRASARLVGLFALLALFLAATGLYGVLSYRVAERRLAIGVRMALGASAGRVVRGVLREGLTLASIGVLAGGAVALAAAPLVRGLLFGIGPRDPGSFVAVSLLLLAIAAAASWLPARRAARVDPGEVLRQG